MFDWNGEQLANIIWGELEESDDHIVPYPEASGYYSDKKEWDQEAVGNKPTEENTYGTRRKLNDTYNLENHEGISGSGLAMDSWVDLSPSKVTKTGQNSIDKVLDKLTEISKFDYSRAQAGHLEKNAEMYSSTHESKEQGEFVDYGWDSIGSFDDFDRIFRNDDQLFGHISLGDPNELWSSTKDVSVIGSHEKSFPSFGLERNVPERADVRTEYLQENQLYKLGCGKIAQGLQRANENVENLELIGDKTRHATKEQAHKQKKLLKCRRKIEVRETRTVQDFYGNWSSSAHPHNQFETNLASPSIKSSPSSNLTQQRQLQAPQSLQYQHMSNAFLPHTAFGTHGNPYSSMHVLSPIQTREFQHQSLLSGYEISPRCASRTNKQVDCPVNMIMTPQEKIEKLRRRQQMQAMLAIQKQQQQFGNQVSCTSHSTSQKCQEETQIQNFEKSDLDAEDISTLPAPDSKSPLEQKDSSRVSLDGDDYSVEDKILYRLQDVISKLDVKIRLCMRDSLFRLAQSAMQRHYVSDTSSNNKNSRDEYEAGGGREINSHTWYAEMPDVETETNPIDRTVAHLLFHRPLELSGKNVHEPFISSQGSKNSWPSARPQNLDNYRTRPCADTFENASHNEPENLAVLEVEAT